MRNLQSAEERECRYIFTVVENFGQLALKVTDVRLEVITLPHFDEEEMVVIFLGLPVGGVLSEERLGYLFESVQRMRRQRVEPILG